MIITYTYNIKNKDNAHQNCRGTEEVQNNIIPDPK